MRVPSGNTTIQKPCSSRSRPRRAMARKAATPRERSMAIGLISARPQPKKGIHRSSRLSTCTCGGKISWNASVSHADWCLERITAGRACRGGRLHVAQRIAHHVGVLERDVEAPRHLEQHSRLGLAALARGLGGMRAEEKGIDAAAHPRCGALQAVVDLEQRAGGEEPARDARLVGRHHHAVAGLRQARDRLEAALDRAQLVERLDVMVAVVVDRAVAIEDDELHAASFERSAMRFMVPCSLPRKPMRLARTRGSLSITMTLSKNASTGAFRLASAFSAPV